MKPVISMLITRKKIYTNVYYGFSISLNNLFVFIAYFCQQSLTSNI